ncbi:MAG: 50S ribosomal protein L15 [Verrucomicrobiota bacterium]
MQLHNYSPNPGAKRTIKRLGCGESSGHGKTSCKGNKGQKARSGSGTRVGFEGGQMPLHRRLPKRGFNNFDFRDKVAVFNVGELDDLFDAGATIDEAALRGQGLINGRCDAVKVLGVGEVTKAFNLVVRNASASAREKIEKAGGTVTAPTA